MIRIKWLGFLQIVASLLFACGASDPTPTPMPAPLPTASLPTASISPAATSLTIVAMGDSLTEGLGVDPSQAYPAQLEAKLRGDGYDVTVINAGVSGETSSGALARVEWVLRLQPDMVILATGGNDSLRGIDPKLTKENLSKLVTTFQSVSSKKIIVVLAGMKTVQNLGEAYSAEFEAIYPAVAEETGVILIPFLLEGVGGKAELNQPDFIHPTAEGYRVVVETIYPYVVEAIGQVR